MVQELIPEQPFSALGTLAFPSTDGSELGEVPWIRLAVCQLICSILFLSETKTLVPKQTVRR